MKSLSKSDYQLACSCPKKLVYKKLYYPTSKDGDEYMQMLAQGGYAIGKMATLMFPDGIEIEGEREACIELTKKYLLKENCVLFEPAFLSDQKLVRVDILVKEGMKIHLIEVKSKSMDSSEKNNLKKLEKEIADVAYQYLVVKELYPTHTIVCSLLTPDKSKRTGIDNLAAAFQIVESTKKLNEVEELPAREKTSFHKPEIIFHRNKLPQDIPVHQILREQGIMSFLEVTDSVLALQNEIKTNAKTFLRILNKGIKDSEYQISKTCKTCEYNTPQEEENGYQECLGKVAYAEHHIFDLYYGGTLKNEDGDIYLDELLQKGKKELKDIDLNNLKRKDGTIGNRNVRQLIQLENTFLNKEWFDPHFKEELKTLKYPLHFIDFETYTGAIPSDRFNGIGMQPYELIAFQWSCHTIKQPGQAPVHSEFIHLENEFPNFKFAEALMKQIGTSGTPLMWATHENTVLKRILAQLDEFGYSNANLRNWLWDMTKENGVREGRWVDMNAMTLQNYFHPMMKGRTSIKKVLPAIWSNFPLLHQVEHFKKYAPEKLLEGIIDPYDKLAKGISLQDDEEQYSEGNVAGGTDAMKAYYRIRFDSSMKKEEKDDLRNQLLEYCKLDTMAMVIIAHHWGLR